MGYSLGEMTDVIGMGNYVGEIRRGPDGKLYQWNEAVDGFGNSFGFWKQLKRFGGKVLRTTVGLTKHIPGVRRVRRSLRKLCRTLPKIAPIASLYPPAAGVVRVGSDLCSFLRKTGLAGDEGEIMQAPSGDYYELVEGIGEFGERTTMLRPVKPSVSRAVHPGLSSPRINRA